MPKRRKREPQPAPPPLVQPPPVAPPNASRFWKGLSLALALCVAGLAVVDFMARRSAVEAANAAAIPALPYAPGSQAGAAPQFVAAPKSRIRD